MSDQESPIVNTPEPAGDKDWQHTLISRLAFAAVTEQRRARRWGIFFKSLFFVYLVVLLVLYSPEKWGTGGIASEVHTALVEVQGIIGADTEASADRIITGLREAFKDKKTKGVILRVNSPGGSPVQAGYVNDEIFRLRDEHPNVPIYAVITDICASGGYYVASAANQIYADKASLVGSIGVVMDGFGFVGAMEKLGVERRIWTAGSHKGMLDPFSPLKAEDVGHIQTVLEDVHKQFVAIVKKGRGERLKNDPGMYSGLVWTGEQSLELGLVDALGSSGFVAREIIGAERIVDFTQREHYLDRLAKRLSTALVSAVTISPALR